MGQAEDPLSVHRDCWCRICLVGLVTLLLATAVLLVARQRAYGQVETISYTPLKGEADWEGEWTLSTRGADPSQAGSLDGTDRVSVPFTGTGFALRVRRGNYRGYLWIRIDGKPASQLPRSQRGAYLILSSPDHEPETVTIPVATNLDDGSHVAEIVADRGWDQWPLVGWDVIRGPDTDVYDRALAALAAGAATCLAGVIGCAVSSTRWKKAVGQFRRGTRKDNPEIGQPRLGVGQLDPILRSPATLFITVAVFYVSPWLPLTLASGVALAGLIVLRLDLGLALVAMSAPFYLHTRALLGKTFSMAEILILLCLLSWMVRQIAHHSATTMLPRPPSSPDCALLYLVVVAIVSTLFADRQHVALRELRVIVLEPALFYLMLRTTRLGEGGVWRIVDGFVVGAAAVAVIGLVQYALDINVITAEQGFRRLRSVYGSPNNAALYLGRALPVLLAVTTFARMHRRRLIYGLLIVPVSLAFLFTFSRAGILLGLPAALLALGLLAGKRWRWVALALIIGAAVGVIPLLTTPRFAGLMDPQSGTLFFRIQLWRASWQMFSHHPWLGVGPDNFLYAYRGRYILPSAWQEPHLSHAHNILLTYATRLGIPGLAAGIWLHAGFWQQAMRALRKSADHNRRALVLGLAGSVAYTTAHGLIDASMFFVDLALAFLLGLGLVQSAGRYHTDG